MPDYYFHYTSRQAAQGIRSAGRIEARAAGSIYLTPDVYEQGADATDALAIDGKPIEVVGLVPVALLGKFAIQPVPPLYDARGRVLRKGGGSQVRIPGPLPGSAVLWLALSPP